jgi:hypothetical protein
MLRHDDIYPVKVGLENLYITIAKSLGSTQIGYRVYYGNVVKNVLVRIHNLPAL